MPHRSKPVSVLLLRHPVSVQQGTDPYHDAFGPFCLPSFELSALDTRSSTPGSPRSEPQQQSAWGDICYRTASGNEKGLDNSAKEELNSARTGPESTSKHDYLMTHHMYSTESNQREFCITSFPILTHQTVHINELEGIIHRVHERSTSFDGIVLPSQRAAQAYHDTCIRVYQQMASQGNHNNLSNTSSAWSNMPFYVVGPATAKYVREMTVPTAFKPSHVRGEQAGNAESLARDVILKDIHTLGKPCEFLYLVGDKRSSSLLDTLRAHHAPAALHELLVYETSKHPRFEANCALLERDLPEHMSTASSSRPSSFSSQLRREGLVMTGYEPVAAEHELETDLWLRPPIQSAESFQSPQPAQPNWIVFFSPSGGNYALPELTQRRWIVPFEREMGSKVACIGATTAQWVRQNLGFEPHAIAARPTPDALRSCITATI